MGHGQFHQTDAAPPLTDKSITSDVAPRQHVFDQAVAGEKSANDWAQLSQSSSDKGADKSMSLPPVELESTGTIVFRALEEQMRRESLQHEKERNHGDKSHSKHSDSDGKHGNEYDYDNAIPMPQTKAHNKSGGYDRAIPIPKIENYDNAIPMPQPKAHNKSIEHK